MSVANPGTVDVQQGAGVSLPAIKGVDSALGQTLKYSASGLPAGLSINSATGVISGKVTFVENDTVHVTATDGTGASATVYFRIEASGSLTADYHAGTGLVESYWDSKCPGRHRQQLGQWQQDPDLAVHERRPQPAVVLRAVHFAG